MKTKEMTKDQVLTMLEPVKIAPVQVKVNGDWETTEHKAVVGEKSHKVYGIHSGKYQLLPHRDAVERVFDALDKGGLEYTPTRLELPKDGAKMALHLRFPQTYEVEPGDILHLELIVQNSYDGMTAFSLEYGAWRLVCSNGMVIGKSLMKYRQEHAIGFLRADELVKDFMKKAISFKKDVLPLFRSFQKLKISKKEGLDLIESLVIAEKWKKEAAQQWMAEKERNGWMFYNVLTYVASHIIKSYNVQRKLQAEAMRIMTARARRSA